MLEIDISNYIGKNLKIVSCWVSLAMCSYINAHVATTVYLKVGLLLSTLCGIDLKDLYRAAL